MTKSKEDVMQISEDQLVDVLFKHRKKMKQLSEELKDQSQAPLIRITSAKELSESEKEKIMQALDRVIDFDHHRVQYTVDSRLIAGYRIQGRSYYYDNSLQRKLKDMRQHLSGM